jgi:hypothetical protein
MFVLVHLVFHCATVCTTNNEIQFDAIANITTFVMDRFAQSNEIANTTIDITFYGVHSLSIALSFGNVVESGVISADDTRRTMRSSSIARFSMCFTRLFVVVLERIIAACEHGHKCSALFLNDVEPCNIEQCCRLYNEQQ